MARIHDLLAEYGDSHQNPVNKRIHWVCVPLIVWSLLGILWSINTPAVFTGWPLPVNWATLLVLLSMVYYLYISKRLSIGVLLASILMLLSLHWLGQTGVSLWKTSIAVFVIAWIGQFIGHSIEGKRPSFFKDIQFLLIGPLWLL
ncbi:MAG: Mpo1-like protein, partial [Gammaproteobacteria bacterium]